MVHDDTWIEILYYRKMKPILIGAKLLLVTTLRQKQYVVVLQNDSMKRVYHTLGAFPSAGLNRCFDSKQSKIFSLFWSDIFVNPVKTSPPKTFGKLRV